MSVRSAPLRAAAASLAAGFVLSLAACGALPDPAVTNAEPEPALTSAAPSPSVSQAQPAPSFAVPASCEALYSRAMFDALQSDNPPLNDPGIDIYATEDVVGLEILAAGIPTIRCTWGAPGGPGLATNVSRISSDQEASLLASFAAAGMACSEDLGGTMCRVERQVMDRDDNIVSIGETQFLRSGGWVATHWVSFAPEGYTEDIVATLWG